MTIIWRRGLVESLRGRYLDVGNDDEPAELNGSIDEGSDDEDGGNDETFNAGCDYIPNSDYAINSLEDIVGIELWNIEDDVVEKFLFGDLSLAFEFYNRLAKSRGFGARKYRTRTNARGVRIIQTFVCSCEGYRPMKFYELPNRKKEPRVERRCGCKARIKVRLDIPSQRWLTIDFLDEHNHPCLAPRFHGMLATHRKMSDGDIMQMNSMSYGGISTSHIYGSLATQSGGHLSCILVVKTICKSWKNGFYNSDAEFIL